MFIIDNFLRSPYCGVKWIFTRVHPLEKDAADAEMTRINKELLDLYRMLEAGVLPGEIFVQREQQLLERGDISSRRIMSESPYH